MRPKKTKLLSRAQKFQLGKTLLRKCIENNASEVIKLINQGAEINYQATIPGAGKITALSYVCAKNNIIIAKALIDHNADMLAICAIEKPDHTFSILTPWLIACSQGYNDICQDMINKDPLIINSISPDNFAGLHIASFANNQKLIEMIINADKQKLMLNKIVKNFTPLSMACLKNHIPSVELLLYKGANPNQYNNPETSPLYCAIVNDHYEIIDLLIKYKVDVNYLNRISKNSPLHYAAIKGNTKIGQLLIDNKANINAINANNVPPLFFAIANQHIPFLEMLLKSGAQVDNDLLLFILVDLIKNETITNLLIKYGIKLRSINEITKEMLTFFEKINEKNLSEEPQNLEDNTHQTPNLEKKPSDDKKQTQKSISETNDDPLVLETNSIPQIHPQQIDRKVTTQKKIITDKKRTLISKSPCKPQKTPTYQVMQAENLNWPKGLSQEQLKNLYHHIRELKYFSPDKKFPEVTKLKNIPHTYRLRIGAIRVIFSIVDEKKEIRIHAIGLRKKVYNQTLQLPKL